MYSHPASFTRCTSVILVFASLFHAYYYGDYPPRSTASRTVFRSRGCRDAEDVDVTRFFDDTTLCGEATLVFNVRNQIPLVFGDTFRTFPAPSLCWDICPVAPPLAPKVSDGDHV